MDDNIFPFVDSVNSSIDQLKEALEPVFATLLEEKIAQCDLAQEKIKVYNSHLYCVISILYCYIKVLGIKTDDHPIMMELERIKLVMKSVKDVEESLKNNDEDKEKTQKEAEEFLQRTLGTKFGAAVPESMKSPAISSSNFQGTHTRFEEAKQETKPTKTAEKQSTKPSGKVTKPSGKVTKPRKRTRK